MAYDLELRAHRILYVILKIFGYATRRAVIPAT